MSLIESAHGLTDHVERLTDIVENVYGDSADCDNVDLFADMPPSNFDSNPETKLLSTLIAIAEKQFEDGDSYSLCEATELLGVKFGEGQIDATS